MSEIESVQKARVTAYLDRIYRDEVLEHAYEKDEEFRAYVDKYMTKMRCTKHEAFEHAVVWEVYKEKYEERFKTRI